MTKETDIQGEPAEACREGGAGLDVQPQDGAPRRHRTNPEALSAKALNATTLRAHCPE